MSELDVYDYDLPKDLVAQFPLPRRSDARLMVVRRETESIEHFHVRDLPELLDSHNMLVVNDTRVLKARLVGYRERTRGRWSGLYLEEQDGLWRVMCKTRGKPEAGEWVMLQDADGRDAMRIQLTTPLGQGQWIVAPEEDASVLDLLERVGRVPLPPYIRGGRMVENDAESYQTVYAVRPGAIAAPTAGLHFTADLLQRLQKRGLTLQRVTLHVGMGTFRPVATERLDDHAMHSEWAEVSDETAQAINQHRDAGGQLLAVGTTVVRALESASVNGRVQALSGPTNLFIRPPYRFQAVDRLLTNFHLPRSTLLILVRTFGGDRLIRRAYQEAIDEGYRFFSYGDAMLIL